MAKKLILFDLDGVLLDSKNNMNIAWDAVCETHKVEVVFEDYFSQIGRPFKEILNILKIKENQNEIENTFNEVSTLFINEVSFFPKVEITIRSLIKLQMKIGIVTSKNVIKTKKILKLLDFEFDIVQTPNHQLRGKPAPDHLLYSMSKQNIDPINTLYVGDMDVDYQAAKRANIDYAHALWGYGQCDDKNTVKLKKISQLLDII
jgi:HAD superfamily hydrolase (TIGR01549 family)